MPRIAGERAPVTLGMLPCRPRSILVAEDRERHDLEQGVAVDTSTSLAVSTSKFSGNAALNHPPGASDCALRRRSPDELINSPQWQDESADRIANRVRSQRSHRRDQIVTRDTGRVCARFDLFRQVVRSEFLPSGGFRRTTAKIRMPHQFRQEFLVDVAASADAAVAIHLRFAPRRLVHEGIDQHATGTGVECDERRIIQRTAGLQVGRVPDAADVLDDAPAFAIAKEPEVCKWCERRVSQSPPSAISIGRKSATTGTPVIAAMIADSPICIVTTAFCSRAAVRGGK